MVLSAADGSRWRSTAPSTRRRTCWSAWASTSTTAGPSTCSRSRKGATASATTMGRTSAWWRSSSTPTSARSAKYVRSFRSLSAMQNTTLSIAGINYEHLLFETDGPLAVVTLNRPNRRNALSLALMRELVGRNINEYREIFDVCVELMTTIESIPQPVIAEVQGMATAAGCQLVATCDLAVAVEEATFATPGVRIGLFCTTPMVALSRAVGRKRALQMLLTGNAIDAKTAVEWGLINSAVPAPALRDESRKLALQIASASPVTLSIGKQAFYSQIDLDEQKAYAYAKEIMTMNALAADAQEGISAFLGKRAACWTGR